MLYTDKRAREAIDYLRTKSDVQNWVNKDLREHMIALMGYAAERMPKKTLKARLVDWRMPGDGLGNLKHVPVEDVPKFIADRMNEGALDLRVGPEVEVYDDN